MLKENETKQPKKKKTERETEEKETEFQKRPRHWTSDRQNHISILQ